MSEVSNEYAKALFMLSCEKGSTDEYKTALEKIEEVFSENPMYLDFLYTFSIPMEERLDALEKAFSSAIPREVLSFLKILCEKKHIREFGECAKYYYALCNQMDKISKVKVTSAVELSENEKAQLKEKLEKLDGTVAQIEYTVDKDILGGLIVEADGKIIDSSVKKHLKDMKDVINK